MHRWRARDGLTLNGWLYRPAGALGAVPTLVWLHGGPEAQERPTFNPLYQELLSYGVAVFAPNVRGSSGFGRRFVDADVHHRRFAAIDDVADIVGYLVHTGLADPTAIGCGGCSYGGYLTLAAMVAYPTLFRVGLDVSGITNFETFFAHTEPWMAAISTVEYGDPVTQKELLRRLSPLHKLDRIKAPTLVLHGANDTNVPVVEAEQVVDNLKRRGVPVEYVLFPDEGHGFRKTPNRIRSTVSIVRWFEEHLKPERTQEGR